MFRLFKRKEVKPIRKNDFNKYKIKISVRSLCFFEMFSGRKYSEGIGEDILLFMYCVLMANNPELRFSYGAFEMLMNDADFSKWITGKFNEISSFDNQIIPKEVVVNNENKTEVSVKDVASMLIVKFGLDPRYVYDEMDMWEVEGYFKVIEDMRKERYEEKRLFTYLTISPHIDTKKCKGPESLMPFPWEKSSKEKAADDLKSKRDMILATLAKMNNKEEKIEENGIE